MLSTKTRTSRCLLAFATAILVSCSAPGNGARAERSVAEFHQRYQRADFEGIYRAADVDFRIAVAEEPFLAYMSLVRQRLGTVRSSVRSGSMLFGTVNWTHYQEQRQTTFQNGEATEHFEWLIDGDSTRLVAYQIVSPLLPTVTRQAERNQE